MPTQLQLEGPDLESLLARVKSELDPTARIVRAEKVRSGGIAGFFARQRFEISVEIEDGDESTPPRAEVPMSLLDLAEQVSRSEQVGLSLRQAGQSRSVLPIPPISPMRPTPTPPTPTPPTPPSPKTEPKATATPAPSFSSAQPAASDDTSFAAVLTQLQTARGTGPAAIPDLAVPQPFAASAAAAPEPAAVAAADSALERSAAQVSTEGTSFAALVAHLEATAGVPSTRIDTLPSPAVPQFLEPRPVDGTVATFPPARTAGAGPAPVAIPVHLPFGRTSSPPTVHGQLARLGLPAHLQPFGPDHAIHSTLLKSLRALPKAAALTNRAGQVVAIVGPLPQSLEAARALARELELQPASAVVLATSRRTLTDLPDRQVLRDIDQAEQRLASWRRRRNTTIVAIDAPMTAAGAVQARAYLAALEPSATWGAVEATRKPLDVGAFARAVGGFDALTLSAVDETSDPAAVLELGIPVARLGEQPATPSAWAALLTGRLAA